MLNLKKFENHCPKAKEMSSKKTIKIVAFINNRSHRKFLFKKLDYAFLPVKNGNTIPHTLKLHRKSHSKYIKKKKILWERRKTISDQSWELRNSLLLRYWKAIKASPLLLGWSPCSLIRHIGSIMIFFLSKSSALTFTNFFNSSNLSLHDISFVKTF